MRLQALRNLCGTAGLLLSAWGLPAVPAAAEETQLPAGYIDEAPLPEGFPPPGEVGRVVEKEYPLARSFSATGMGAFMQCFAYLSRHRHGMTAPVVMEYDAAREAAEESFIDVVPRGMKRMHFMLERVAQDEPKQEGNVTVADMPKQRVLSIAYQGQLKPEVVRRLEARLQAELKSRADVAEGGELRVLGYNGPSVPRDKVYWEVQIPIVPAKAR